MRSAKPLLHHSALILASRCTIPCFGVHSDLHWSAPFLASRCTTCFEVHYHDLFQGAPSEARFYGRFVSECTTNSATANMAAEATTSEAHWLSPTRTPCAISFLKPVHLSAILAGETGGEMPPEIISAPSRTTARPQVRGNKGLPPNLRAHPFAGLPPAATAFAYQRSTTVTARRPIVRTIKAVAAGAIAPQPRLPAGLRLRLTASGQTGAR